MSGNSPSRRLRAKTSEFTDLFRAGNGSSQTRQTQKEPSVNLEVPSSDTEVISKKRITRIQLFGRSRKKSTQSTASSPYASHPSSDLGELLTRKSSSDRRPSTTNEPPPPLPTKIPSHFGSKLAATFGNSRLPKPSASSTRTECTQTECVQTESASVTRPSTLSASTSRAASYESGSSNGSRTRSTTPRPLQPVITVSLSPDDLSDYKDLFTRPPQDQDVPASPTPPSSRLPKYDSPIYPRRGQTPASAIAAAHRHATCTGEDRSPSRSSRYSRKNSDSDKGPEESPGPSSAQESPRLTPDGEKGLPPSLQRHPSSATGSGQSPEISYSPMRSRMRPPTTLPRHKPPSIPLPQTPGSPTPPPSEMPPSPPLRQPSKTEPDFIVSQKIVSRPRAHTIASVGNSSLPVALSHPTINIAATLSPPSTDISEINFDIETASAPQLREALKTRNHQYDELATYVLKVTEAHVTEMTNLKQRVFSLDKEISRRDKELKGLRWIINHGDSSHAQPLPAGVLNHSLLSPVSFSESDQDNSKTVPGSSRRLNYQSDSGTESHAESIRSAASGSESVSSIRYKPVRKPSTLAEVTYNFCRAGSTRRSSKLPPGLGSEKIPEMPNKRSSLNSVSASPSSSASSLLPPSPSITISSLSAIPEGPPSALRSTLRYDNSDQEEHRVLRASNRASTSSMTSSSTAASSAYSTNIKRSRPPSIAQVLEKTPIMDDVLDKLRPFA